MLPAALAARKFATLAIGLAIALAFASVAVVALIVANSTAGCVNTALGDRAKGNEIEQSARYEATVTELRYLQGRASKQLVIVKKDAYVRAQDAAEAYRAAHPAGRC